MAYDNGFEPLKVTAALRTGVVADTHLPLDALLYYQAYRARYGSQDVTIPGGHDPGGRGKRVDMPLAIVHAGRPDWYYACSFAQPRPWWITEAQDHWNKRFDTGFAGLVHFGGRRGSVNVKSGPMRAYHFPVVYRVAVRVEWYAVGHARRIRDLLSTLTHVGKKVSQGWGRVSRWEVEPWPEDWSVWRGEQLMRAVPAGNVVGRGSFHLAYYGLRPSYYRQDNQCMVAVPG